MPVWIVRGAPVDSGARPGKPGSGVGRCSIEGRQPRRRGAGISAAGAAQTRIGRAAVLAVRPDIRNHAGAPDALRRVLQGAAGSICRPPPPTQPSSF